MSYIKSFVIRLINLAFLVTIIFMSFALLTRYVMQPFTVDGYSMEPTLYNGDQMILFKLFELERFDIVVFPDPRGSGISYVKRVIGLPGDNVKVEDDILYINDTRYDEPYLNGLNKSHNLYTKDFTLWNTVGLNQIPPGFVFVLGDNRPNSGDSRQFGLVSIDQIEGEANFIITPFDRTGFIKNYSIEE